MNQPKRLEKARILIANTAMDTDKIKVFGSKVRVDSTAKVAELEMAEKVRKYIFIVICASFIGLCVCVYASYFSGSHSVVVCCLPR